MRRIKTYMGWQVDFSSPKGEPSLVPPNSISWRIFKNPVALAIGGVAAVLLEFADPRIRTGVWEHSTFRVDPIGRSTRTGLAALIGVYGPESAARRIIAGVTQMHGRVTGATPAGEPYRALVPELLEWVAATAAYGFINAYDQYVTPLAPQEHDQFYLDAAATAQLYGAKMPIRSRSDFAARLDRVAGRFEPHEINTEFLQIIKTTRLFPGLPRGLNRAVANAAVGLLPGRVRAQLCLGDAYDLSPSGAWYLKRLGALADRLPIPGTPAVVASQRLGLPWNFLYKDQVTQEKILRSRPDLLAQPASGLPKAATG